MQIWSRNTPESGPNETLEAKAENRGVVVTEAGSYFRLIDSCITQLKAQRPSKSCNESEEEEQGVHRVAVRGHKCEHILLHFAPLINLPLLPIAFISPILQA